MCGVNVLKNNIRVLLSIFCIMSSCVFTIMFLTINDNTLKNSEIVTIKNASTGTLVSNVKNASLEEDKKDVVDLENDDDIPLNEEISEEVKEEDLIVYDGMTMEELASKLDRSFKNELSGKGYLYASYSLEKGVDPYLAAAISLEETGCNYNCSNLVKSCNNVGGMVGSGCNGFSAWPTLDDGIRAFIDNIYRNYVAYGLTTADTMNPKYAENPMWSVNVNNYINIIKNN